MMSEEQLKAQFQIIEDNFNKAVITFLILKLQHHEN